MDQVESPIALDRAASRWFRSSGVLREGDHPMNAVTIRGPQADFPQLAEVDGLSVDHGAVGVDGADQILSAYATDEAVTAIRALGFTVDVDATPEQQNELLAQVLQEGGPDVSDIAIA
jgi:hypothetical protein